jgi:tungstate transport system ATP-binding protein
VSGNVLRLVGVDTWLGPARQVHALKAVGLSVQAGERVALVGANGSGKSTLLRVAHGVLPVHGGTLERPPGLRMAMLFQRPHLLRLSAWNNVALGLWMAGHRWPQARALAAHAIEQVGLSPVLHRNGRALSGGQQQRLALARAWALQPDLWLLDEPTASLDPHAKREVEALVAAFAAPPASPGQPPPTLLFASHNLGQVKRLASRVVYLEGGRVLADLPVHDFFDGPLLADRHPEAHAFVKGETA